MSCEFKEKTQWYCENFAKIVEAEEHISNCQECRELLDENIKRLELPKEDMTDENTNLLKKVLKRRRDTRRILIFSIIGMFMGFFSFTYRQQNIFILKLIIGIPYKIMEMFMLYIRPEVTDIFSSPAYMDNSIFLKFRVLSAVAERVLPCIIGGCIYGSIGYITGDKSIFTLKKFVVFISKWAAAAALCVGLLFATYYHVSDASYSLKDISGFMIATSSNGAGFDGSRGVYADYGAGDFESLVKGLNNSKIADRQQPHGEYKEMMPITIFGKWYFEINAMLDLENDMLYMDNGDVYEVPESFVKTCINIDK